MKQYLAIFALTCMVIQGFSQQKQLPVDGQGRYLYYEVVEAKQISKDTLLNRAKHFLKVPNKKMIVPLQVTDSSLTARRKFVIEKTILVASHPSGEVTYALTLEFRKDRYRFWLSDFEFVPYQRDRYGNFVATTAKGTPLEKTPGKLNAGEWKAILAAAYDKTTKFAEELKKAMTENTPVETVKKPAAVSKEW